MDPERTGELPASVRKDAKHVESGPTGPITNNHSRANDVEYTQRIPKINDGAWMSNPLSFPLSSANSLRQRPHCPSDASSLVTGSHSSESSPEVEIASPNLSPIKNRVDLSRRLQKTSEYISTSISPPPSMPVSRVRVEVRPSPNTANKAISKSSSTVPLQLRSSQFFSISTDDEPPVSKKRRTHRHTSLDAGTVLNPDSPFTLEYDLDRDPTQQAYEFREQFHERSPFSAILSARFIHAHLFEKLSGSTTLNDDRTNSEGDLVTEFIEAAALSSVGPHDEAGSPYALDPVEVLGNPEPTPGYGDLGLEGAVHVADPFTVPTMDDVINHQPWWPDAQTVIDPSLLGGTPAFSEPRSPSPAPTQFRDFHLWKRTRTSSPPLTQSALTIRIPSLTSASTSGSNSTQAPRDSEDNPGGGKAKFYKKGALQTPPHLSNSQRRRSVSVKTAGSIHISHHPEIDSPLTELSASDLLTSGFMSTSPIATVANALDEDATVIGSRSGTPPPRVNGITTATDKRGPYRIVAVNQSTHCHQCRRTTPHPKMRCRTCVKNYCIMCIVKRYHDIEFHQFKKDFDCPACLNKCNCTACCDKRREVYVTTRHIKFDKETTAKLLSGEIRSLPHLSGSLAGPRKKLAPGQDPISSRYREPPLAARKEKMPARRRRVSNRRYTYDDDYDESDASEAPNSSVRVKPTHAALQTQRMLEESGDGRYWGTVYSLSGERVGTSFVGNNLQNVTVQTDGFSSALVGEFSSSPSRRWRNRMYVGRWQDTWGCRPETLNDSHPEDEMRANRRSRNNKELGRARSYYVGNKNVIRAWRKVRSKTAQRPSAVFPPSDDISPSDPPPFDMARDRYEETDVPQNGDIPIDGEDEGEDDRSFWIMEDRSSPKKPNLLLAANGTPRPSLGDANDLLDICRTPALEPCGQLVTQDELVKAVTSGLQAVGTTVLLPQPPLSPSPLGP